MKDARAGEADNRFLLRSGRSRLDQNRGHGQGQGGFYCKILPFEDIELDHFDQLVGIINLRRIKAAPRAMSDGFKLAQFILQAIVALQVGRVIVLPRSWRNGGVHRCARQTGLGGVVNEKRGGLIGLQRAGAAQEIARIAVVQASGWRWWADLGYSRGCPGWPRTRQCEPPVWAGL